jgi:hypothetical protein
MKLKTKKKLPVFQNGNPITVKENLITNYLLMQFPWFSEREIKKVVDLMEADLDKVTNYLHDKSGTRRISDDPEY